MPGSHILLYDGACGFCRRVVAWVQAKDRDRRFRALPYQEAPALSPELKAACRKALHVVRADGGILRGGRAVLFILESLGWGPVARVLARPPFVWPIEGAYRLVARKRAFFGGLLPRKGPAPFFFQTWRNLAFLHWDVEPGVLQALLPPGLTVDTFGGRAYVGLVAFTMADVHPRFLPAVPCLSTFQETNVRTYVKDAQGRPGVWFFSLDAASAPAVALGRAAYHLPYWRARLDRVRSGTGRILHSGRRNGSAEAGYAFTLAVGDPVEARPGSLEHFLVERYRLFAHDGRRLITASVEHRPYPLRAATVDLRAETLLAAAGIPRGEAPPRAHHAAEVVVAVFRPEAAEGTSPASS